MHALTPPPPTSAAIGVESASLPLHDPGVAPREPASLTMHDTVASPKNLIATSTSCCSVAGGLQLWISPAIPASAVGSAPATPALLTAVTAVFRTPGGATVSRSTIPLRI